MTISCTTLRRMLATTSDIFGVCVCVRESSGVSYPPSASLEGLRMPRWRALIDSPSTLGVSDASFGVLCLEAELESRLISIRSECRVNLHWELNRRVFFLQKCQSELRSFKANLTRMTFHCASPFNPRGGNSKSVAA